MPEHWRCAEFVRVLLLALAPVAFGQVGQFSWSLACFNSQSITHQVAYSLPDISAKSL